MSDHDAEPPVTDAGGDSSVHPEAGLAHAIRAAREAAGLNQTQLANLVGFSREYVSRAERPSKGLASRGLVEAIDGAVEAGGSLVALHEQLHTQRLTRRARTPKSSPSPPPAAEASHPVSWEPDLLLPGRERQIEPTVLASEHASRDAQSTSGLLGSGDVTPALSAAILAAAEHTEATVIDHLRGRLQNCKKDDGFCGPGAVLADVLALITVIRQKVVNVGAKERAALLVLGADGAEFASWLYRDLRDTTKAIYWLDRAMEWAQEAGDGEMQGYVLLRKSQMAYEDRDALRVLTLAQAARHGPWALPSAVQAEIIQQEARGLAMTGESDADVERALGLAETLIERTPTRPDEHTRLGVTYIDQTHLLRTATCLIEAGRPARAAVIFTDVLAAGAVSRRDEGYLRARAGIALALSGEPDQASVEGVAGSAIASVTRSERTTRELRRLAAALAPWAGRPGSRALRDAIQQI